MSLNVGKELAVLERMTAKQLRTRYAEVIGEETRAHNRPWLIKRITWRLQVLAEGDLSERALQRAAELACDADLRMSPPRVAPVKNAESPPTRSGQPGIADCLAACSDCPLIVSKGVIVSHGACGDSTCLLDEKVYACTLLGSFLS